MRRLLGGITRVADWDTLNKDFVILEWHIDDTLDHIVPLIRLVYNLNHTENYEFYFSRHGKRRRFTARQ